MFKSISATFAISIASLAAFAQEGQINDVFTGPSTAGWKANTKGATAEVKGDKLVIVPAAQPNGDYRGDINKGPLTVHAGKFPILAIKMKRPPEATLVFDSNLGTYTGWKGGFTKITTTDGLEVYYIDLAKKPFKRGNDESSIIELSKTEATVFKSAGFKIAGIKYTQEQIDNNQVSYEIAWIKTFASEEELKAFLKPAVK